MCFTVYCQHDHMSLPTSNSSALNFTHLISLIHPGCRAVLVTSTLHANNGNVDALDTGWIRLSKSLTTAQNEKRRLFLQVLQIKTVFQIICEHVCLLYIKNIWFWVTFNTKSNFLFERALIRTVHLILVFFIRQRMIVHFHWSIFAEDKDLLTVEATQLYEVESFPVSL